MYVFHNKVFKERAANNTYLQQKYDFLRDEVFHGLFENTSYEKDGVPAKIWDVTKVVIKTNALTDIFTVMKELFSDAII